jgi:hypothetical protein
VRLPHGGGAEGSIDLAAGWLGERGMKEEVASRGVIRDTWSRGGNELRSEQADEERTVDRFVLLTV